MRLDSTTTLNFDSHWNALIFVVFIVVCVEVIPDNAQKLFMALQSRINNSDSARGTICGSRNQIRSDSCKSSDCFSGSYRNAFSVNLFEGQVFSF